MGYQAEPVKCKSKGCTERHYAKGLCKKHYTQTLRYGKLTPDRERGQVRICKVKGCGRSDTIKSLCRKHSRQVRVHGKLTPEREHMVGFVGCSQQNCKGAHRARGLCAKHYNEARWKRVRASKGKKKK